MAMSFDAKRRDVEEEKIIVNFIISYMKAYSDALDLGLTQSGTPYLFHSESEKKIILDFLKSKGIEIYSHNTKNGIYFIPFPKTSNF